MASKCFMCGSAIVRGILCEKCDKPRRPKAVETRMTDEDAAARTPVPQAAPSRSDAGSPPMSAAAHAKTIHEDFPKAPVVPFPIDSVSPAITSVANVLIAAGVPSIVLGPDRAVKFVTEEAKKLFSVPQSDLGTVKQIEALSGVRIEDLTVPASSPARIRNRNVLFSVVPLAGGASGAVIIFRDSDPINAAHGSFAAFVRETVLSPLRSLREAMSAASRSRQHDPLLEDSAATIDQILSSLEMAPQVEEPAPATRIPRVVDVIRAVAERFKSFAELKRISVQVDVPGLEERFRSHEQLSEALGVLMDNALHYVAPGGQVVAGVRWMEHKGRPLLLFFVMDNGPLVPEEMRQRIFEPDFTWNPAASERSGRSLFRVREFAVANGGSVWVEAKTGKACTFFVRVRPDTGR